MERNSLKKYLAVTPAVASQTVLAQETSSGRLSDLVTGLLAIVVTIALAYAIVFLVRHLTPRKQRGPDEMNAIEFTKYTTPSDRPSIER